MPLSMIGLGKSGKIQRISGSGDVRRFLSNLGFVEGREVTVLSDLGGDVITAIDGKPIRDYSDYFAALFSTAAGDKVDITVLRNGREVVLPGVELVEQTEENSRWLVR